MSNVLVQTVTTVYLTKSQIRRSAGSIAI